MSNGDLYIPGLFEDVEHGINFDHREGIPWADAIFKLTTKLHKIDKTLQVLHELPDILDVQKVSVDEDGKTVRALAETPAGLIEIKVVW